jgi:hypothetical protein
MTTAFGHVMMSAFFSAEVVRRKQSPNYARVGDWRVRMLTQKLLVLANNPEDNPSVLCERIVVEKFD